ncbi:LapA family protein [Desulfofalx alkaliphila]|uniref:LapA family protein n=1 Tax=Desulfofalx alkaliphila TaxID=105483 RepID=UPI000550ABA5|nr:lipopolysaccharide assembly protein LapA domain-containing protein [Desulfofalx alkaliphila]
MQLYAVLGLLFALLVAMFAVQNSTAVDIRILTWKFSNISLVLVILGSVVGGALIAFLLGLPKQLRNMIKIKELSAQNQRLVTEVDRLTQELGQEKEMEEPKEEKPVVNE